MNLLLLEPEDLVDAQRAVVRGRRLRHVVEVHRAKVGQSLRVGVLGGSMGFGVVRELQDDRLELELSLDQAPPAAASLRVVLALPRPKVLRRVLTSLVTLGVKELVLLHCVRVEKSYWQSPMVQEDAVREHLILALEQAVDTILPRVDQRRFFKPFVEDELEDFAGQGARLLAHPHGTEPAPRVVTGPATLAFGPEGGFIPYEVDRLTERGFRPVGLGPRVHRVETAVPALLGRCVALPGQAPPGEGPR